MQSFNEPLKEKKSRMREKGKRGKKVWKLEKKSLKDNYEKRMNSKCKIKWMKTTLLRPSYEENLDEEF